MTDDDEGALAGREYAELAKKFMDIVNGAPGELKRPVGHRHFYDEMLEFSLDIRMRVEAGQGKDRILRGAVERVFDWIRDPELLRLAPPKGQVERLSTLTKDLVARNPPLLEGKTPEERVASFRRLVAHAEGIWRDSVRLYESGSYPRACFFAITCLEEIGKAVPARFIVKVESIYGALTEAKVAGGPGRNPMRIHEEKHFLAAATGVRVNPRLEPIFGKEEAERIAAAMESDELKNLRELCLYVDVQDSGEVVWPEEQITGDLAKKWIVVAGEVLAEVLGFPAAEWERLLAAVREFEAAVGISDPGNAASAP